MPNPETEWAADMALGYHATAQCAQSNPLAIAVFARLDKNAEWQYLCMFWLHTCQPDSWPG
eukprot:577003-Pelagomonas_calceolata.AAC.8